MQSAAVILATLALGFGSCSTTYGSDDAFTRHSRHVPFLASVRFMGHHRCSGAVIEERLVITAAQCVLKANWDYLEVAVGEGMKSAHQVRRVMVQPQYDPFNQDYDMALIKTKTSLLSTDYVAAIELAAFPLSTTKLNGPPYIIEWNSSKSDVVVKGASPVPAMTPQYRVSSRVIYAGVRDISDVGAPLVRGNHLYGLLSGRRRAGIGGREVGVFASLYPYANHLRAAAAGDSNDQMCDALRTIISSLKDMLLVPGFLVSAVEYLANTVGCKFGFQGHLWWIQERTFYD